MMTKPERLLGRVCSLCCRLGNALAKRLHAARAMRSILFDLFQIAIIQRRIDMPEHKRAKCGCFRYEAGESGQSIPLVDQKVGHSFGAAFGDAAVVALAKFCSKCGDWLPTVECVYGSVSSLGLSSGASGCVRLCRCASASKHKCHDGDEIKSEHGLRVSMRRKVHWRLQCGDVKRFCLEPDSSH